MSVLARSACGVRRGGGRRWLRRRSCSGCRWCTSRCRSTPRPTWPGRDAGGRRWVSSRIFASCPMLPIRSSSGSTSTRCIRSANVDLAQGPVVLSVPEMGDRYWLVQLIDAWNNVPAVPGSRTLGGARRELRDRRPGMERSAARRASPNCECPPAWASSPAGPTSPGRGRHCRARPARPVPPRPAEGMGQ